MPDSATTPIADKIKRRLVASLSPARIDLEDRSDRHIGHAGHDGRGESHFALTIESAAFTGLSRIERQRLVHHGLGDLLRERVHALTIRAVAPGEA
jgi:BolA protein